MKIGPKNDFCSGFRDFFFAYVSDDSKKKKILEKKLVEIFLSKTISRKKILMDIFFLILETSEAYAYSNWNENGA